MQARAAAADGGLPPGVVVWNWLSVVLQYVCVWACLCVYKTCGPPFPAGGVGPWLRMCAVALVTRISLVAQFAQAACGRVFRGYVSVSSGHQA